MNMLPLYVAIVTSLAGTMIMLGIELLERERPELRS
jgi:hypothetical protein